MKVLSLFDGISCGRVALERAGIPVEKYYASEIDKYAIQISKKNYPDIIPYIRAKFSTLNPPKAQTMLARQYANYYGTYLGDGESIRRLTPIECERLQTMPDNYTAGVSDSQRYKMLGNGWTVDVIAHLLKGLK